MSMIPMTANTDWLRSIRSTRLLRTVVLLALALLMGAAVQQKSVVRAVLFFSPSCPHCHDVMDNHLPPLLAKHGNALQIVAVNVETADGQELYQRVALHFALPRERLGVPALVVGDRVLVGSGEIPAELPRIVEAGLAAGGIDWPAGEAIRGFLRVNGLLEEKPAETPSVEANAAPAEQRTDPSPAAGAPALNRAEERPPVERNRQLPEDPGAVPAAAANEPAGLVLVESEGAGPAAATPWQKFGRDPVGNGISAIILVAMIVIAALAIRGVAFQRGSYGAMPRWAVPVLTVIGVGIAAYMSFVEVTHAQAVCGPVGDCNAVQSSPYAAILGIPIGVLGLLGYAAIGAGWFWVIRADERARRRGTLWLWSASLGGVLFSIYLTFLEPFVIGATCIWCLNSAVVMTLILAALTPGAMAAVHAENGFKRPSRDDR